MVGAGAAVAVRSSHPVKTPGEDVVVRSVESALEGRPSRIERCPNCDSEQVDSFCAACGQRAGNLRTTVGQFVRDALDGLFSFDSRMWRTFIALLWRPGSLTVDYWQGRRARYVAPLRLYLFVSFLVFLFVALFAGDDVVDTTGENQAAAVRLSISEGEEEDKDDEADMGWFVERVLLPVTEEPERFGTLFVQRLPWMFFALVPVFAALLRLLFRRRERFYVPHLVFALHFHAAAFLLYAVSTALSLLWSEFSNIGGLAVLVVLFLSLRRVYGDGRIKTLAKEACLFVVHGLAISIGFGVLLIVTSLAL